MFERSITIVRVDNDTSRSRADTLAVEEPLEIRLACDDRPARAISITMRTPGHDFELAAGFLFTEGLVSGASQIARIDFCGKPGPDGELRNTVKVELKPGVSVDVRKLDRNFYTTSSCGVCGKASLEALRTQSRHEVAPGAPRVAVSVIHGLPAALRRAQSVFDTTGGLHASALFDRTGALELVREDVGRHNALDKIIGRAALDGLLPLHDRVLLVSGRASFELLQKASMAGIGFVAAIGAPSSLALEVARDRGMTLVGFVRNNGFNVYCGPERLQ